MSKERVERIKRLVEYDRPLWIAAHFGFTPIVTPTIKRSDVEITNDCKKSTYYDAAEKAAVTRLCLESPEPLTEHPLTIAFKRSSSRDHSNIYSLHYIGSNSGLAEALLIRSALSILSEAGYKNLSLEANSIGDKDSISIYERELSNYFKKVTSFISENDRTKAHEDIFEILKADLPEEVRLRHVLPNPISHLTPSSRLHFKEVLEYIEALDIEFRIAPELVGESHHSSHTIFAIRNNAEGETEPLALGYRYSRMARRFGHKKEVPMVGINIFYHPTKETGKKLYREPSKPKFYLVHLGNGAKMRAIPLLEQLRREHIRVHHYLGRDKLAAQTSTEECLLAPYHIILGQKEALDGTATVRNVSTRAQETVPVASLAHFLKNIPI